MHTKSVITRATAGCVQRGMFQTTPFSGRGRRGPTTQHTAAEHRDAHWKQNKISVIEQLAYKNKAFNIVLQETHCSTADKLVIPNFSLPGSILSRNYGLATFVHERLQWSLVDQSPEQSETEWLCADVAGYKIINVYKPPRSRLTPTTIPTFPHPSLYVGDFNCQHVNWVYNTTSPDGDSLHSWATSNNLGLLYSPKETAGFFSRRWNVGTNPEMAFASFGQDSRLPNRRVLESSRSHNIGPPSQRHQDSRFLPIAIRWRNFRKADWKHFCLLTGESVERLPPPDRPNIQSRIKGYGGQGQFLLKGPYDVIHDVCKRYDFADSQLPVCFFPVVKNVLTQMLIQLAARREFMM